MKRIAIYPGSFDPITAGHLDIIKRSSKLFDEVIVAVMSNSKKESRHSFSVEERVALITKCIADFPNVSADHSPGLLAEYAKEKNACVIVKGLRAVSDFENEFLQALINKRLNENIETVFLAADSDHMFMSSSMIKQVCRLGGDVSPFLPAAAAEEIIRKIREAD